MKKKLQIHPVKWIDQVLELALETMPQPLAEKPAEIVAVVAEVGADANTAITH